MYSVTVPYWKIPSSSDLLCISSRISGLGRMRRVLKSATCNLSTSLHQLDQLHQLLPVLVLSSSDVLTPCHSQDLCAAVNHHYPRLLFIFSSSSQEIAFSFYLQL